MVLLRLKANSVANAHTTYQLPPLETLLSDRLSLFLWAKCSYLDFFLIGSFQASLFPLKIGRCREWNDFQRKEELPLSSPQSQRCERSLEETLTFAWTKGERERKKSVSLVTFFCKQGFEGQDTNYARKAFCRPSFSSETTSVGLSLSHFTLTTFPFK